MTPKTAARYGALMAAETRAHERFMRRSDRCIATFPEEHDRLHKLALEAATLAYAIRAELRRAGQ